MQMGACYFARSLGERVARGILLGFEWIGHSSGISTDEAAGLGGSGSVCCHSSRGGSQTLGVQIAAEQICSGGARPDLAIQHLQCGLQVRGLRDLGPWEHREHLGRDVGFF